MKFKKLALSTLLFLSFLTGCGDKESINENVLSANNNKSYSFDLKTTQNKSLSIEVDKGKWKFDGAKNKAVLVVFFATWCPPCKAEIPHLLNLKKQFGEKFEIIGVLVEDGKTNDEINKFIEENKINYPISNTPENFVLASAIGGVSTIPAMFLFSKNGDLVQSYTGMTPEEMLASDISKGIQ